MECILINPSLLDPPLPLPEPLPERPQVPEPEPESELVPLEQEEIKVECLGWEDTGALPPGVPKGEGKRHVRYHIKVNNCGQEYELRKRWQELSDLSASLNKLDSFLAKGTRWRANGEKGLPGKYTKAGFVSKELDGRAVEINIFFEHLSTWMTRLNKASGGGVNLLNTTFPNLHKDVLAEFFAPDS
eukprot:COSAG06_NODE_1189_length_10331_cov_10.869038_2_plen_187_part_00